MGVRSERRSASTSTYVFDFCGAVERRLRGAVAVAATVTVAVCVDSHSEAGYVVNDGVRNQDGLKSE